MAWTFPTGQPKKRNQIIAVDIGARTSKAVHLQRSEGGFELLHYALQDAPGFENGFSPERMAEHLQSLTQALGGKTKFITFALGAMDSMLRPAELPLVPLSEMRQMLKYNAKAYFQQDFPDYAFDCFILPPPAGKNPAEVLKPNQKCRVLVGGAKRQLLEAMQAAAKNAGFVAEEITPGAAGLLAAFEMAQPEVFSQDVVALVDIGFKTSAINVLLNGEPTMNRVVPMGGDHLTNGLAEAMSISYAEAEGIKLGMPEEVQSAIVPLLMPLGRELRASIDFFEHQQDRPVNRVFISGGSARSRFLVEALQSEMMVPCESWNPLSSLKRVLSESQSAESEQLAPQLTIAIGAGVATLS